MTANDLTEMAVIEGAIEQLSGDGFTGEAYLQDMFGTTILRPGDAVVMTCAIGGVEQALWKITGTHLADAARSFLAYDGVVWSAPASVPKDEIHVTYWNVMNRLNRIAREMFDGSDGTEECCNVEDVTCRDDDAQADTLRVFARAAEELRTA